MSDYPPREIDRQYRLVDQAIGMHAMLRDEYSAKAKIAKIVLVGASVMFATTGLAADNYLTRLGLHPEDMRLLLRVASVLALIASISLLILDWEGTAARHMDGVKHWSNAKREFRRLRDPNGSWPEEVRGKLATAYWNASDRSVPIPDKRFAELKSRFLRKVAISKMLSRHPGCPRFVAWIAITARESLRAIRSQAEEAHDD